MNSQQESKLKKLGIFNLTQAEEKGVIRFDPNNRELATLLSQMEYPEFPVPMGVLFSEDRPTFDEQVHGQIRTVQEKKPPKSDPDEALREIFHSGDVWTVK